MKYTFVFASFTSGFGEIILATSIGEKGKHYKDFSPIDVASIHSRNAGVK